MCVCMCISLWLTYNTFYKCKLIDRISIEEMIHFDERPSLSGQKGFIEEVTLMQNFKE